MEERTVIRRVDGRKPSGETKLKKLVEYMQGLRENAFTGYIKVNFTQGSIGRVERHEEILSKNS